jgi:prevent-host-death family protein
MRRYFGITDYRRPTTLRGDRRHHARGRRRPRRPYDLPATFVYMTTVGVAELRQNLSRYLRLVAAGERLVVTERNRPVAELGPPPSTGEALDRLIAEGRVSRPTRQVLPEPLKLDGDPRALSRALDEIRGDR